MPTILYWDASVTHDIYDGVSTNNIGEIYANFKQNMWRISKIVTLDTCTISTVTIRIKGPNASFGKICSKMNQQSNVPSEICPIGHLY